MVRPSPSPRSSITDLQNNSLSWPVSLHRRNSRISSSTRQVSHPSSSVDGLIEQAMTFNPEIVSVDTCRVYHSGPNYFVEVDIVLSPEMPLWKAHDISQDLQDQIEALPDVDRCFVHVDHEVDHKPVRLPRKATCSGVDLSRSIGRRSSLSQQLEILTVSPNTHALVNVIYMQSGHAYSAPIMPADHTRPQ